MDCSKLATASVNRQGGCRQTIIVKTIITKGIAAKIKTPKSIAKSILTENTIVISAKPPVKPSC